MSVNTFFVVYGSGLAILIVSYFVRQQGFVNIEKDGLFGHIFVFTSSVVYLSIVGLYDELPTDVYKHLEHFKGIANHIDSGNFSSFTGLAHFDKSVQYWYHLPTLITEFIGQEFSNKVEVFATINVIILLICVYEFAYWLFEKTTSKKSELLTLSLLSVFFFVTHFGINVFSFIRYYSIAPSILNYAIYLTAIICFFNYYRCETGLLKFLSMSILLFCSAFLIHAQEAMFIGTIYAVIMLIVIVKNKATTFGYANNIDNEKLPHSFLPLTIATTVIVCLAYFYTINNLPVGRVIKPKIIPLTDLINIGNGYFVLNPFIQFYTVLTHWGLFVYFLYILFYRKYFTNQPFLLAAMLIPILTVFNPIFTNFFLRIGYSDVLWRFLYMLPIYLVAARLTTALIFEKPKRISLWLVNSFIMFLIFVFLLPINIGPINLPYSRIYSLGQPHHQAQPQYWQDMLNYLQKLPKKEIIITDPVTGYMISALTKHVNRRYKFHVRKMRDPYIFDDYTDHPLKRYANKILIINRRKGMSTKTAKISRHWNPHALKLTEYYNDDLIKHVEHEIAHFIPLWQKDDVIIYRINY